MSTARTTALLFLVVGAALAGCGDDDALSTAAPQPSTTAPAQATPTASRAAGSSATLTRLPVYWIGESRRSFRLYREFRDVPDAGGPIASAVAAMTRMEPLDPDYTSPWRPASRVTVTRSGDALTVDLSVDAVSGAGVGSEVAERAVQQLVYTATAAASKAGTPVRTVRVLVDGRARDAWGAVRLGEPTERAPLADVQAQAWVIDPQQGDAESPGTVAFVGFGTSFEAAFSWKVTSAAGAVVAHGTATGGTGNGGFGEVRWTATLTPGTYTVQLATDDPSGGAEGNGPATDDKRFTVR